MSTIRNKVQLIGNVGNTPEVRNLESGKKVASFPIAPNEFYKNSNGEKIQDTQWHNIVAWGKTAEIIEQYVNKGKEIAIEGKLTSRSYETSEGEKRYVTEVIASEILLNNANRVKGVFELSSGGITGTLVDTRILFAVVLKSLTVNLILCHNHPSGTLKPSEADKRLTQKIAKAAAFFDIKVLDHLILSPDGSYFSFADEGML